jgi:hypothetical protein
MAQRVDVTWVALECRMRQEGSDEIYGTVNAIMPGGQFVSHSSPETGRIGIWGSPASGS